MDIGKAFGFVFEDEQWVGKVAVGGVVLLVPIVNFAVLGYTVKIAQNVVEGNQRPLPEWGQFGDHFMRGLYWVVISIVYSLPAILLNVLFSCVLGGAASAVDSESGEGVGAISTLALCFIPLLIIVALACAVLSYGALARFVATNQLSEAFKFGEVVASIRNHLGDWLMLLLVAILAGLIGGLGVIACGIGVLFTSFYAQCVTGFALGQLVAKQNSGLAVSDIPPGYGPPPSYQ